MTAILSVVMKRSGDDGYVLLHQEDRPPLTGSACPVRVGECIILGNCGYAVTDVIMDVNTDPKSASDLFVVVTPDAVTQSAIEWLRAAGIADG